jgi:hypothetical protein
MVPKRLHYFLALVQRHDLEVHHGDRKLAGKSDR